MGVNEGLPAIDSDSLTELARDVAETPLWPAWST
jgi:hypothetical protein